jgi:hypothetical protein
MLIYTAAMFPDVRYALRLFARRPGVTALIVATLAIGIAASTAVFSVADAILWDPRKRRFRAAAGRSRDVPRTRSGNQHLVTPNITDCQMEWPAFDPSR